MSFTCISCRQIIAPTNPRIHCLSCPNYDLCANCGLAERFAPGHQELHPVQLFKQSGGLGIPAEAALTPNQYLRESQQIDGQASTPTAAYVHPPPPRQSLSQSTMPQAQVIPSAQGWQSFFNPNSTPTPTFVTLMNDIFTHLDPMNNGNLEPETFSRFLDDMGYAIHENAWKSGLQGGLGISKESSADRALKAGFDLFNIDHVLLQRIRPLIQPSSSGSGSGLSSFTRALRGSVVPQTTHQGPMPAITRKGFLDLAQIQMLAEPSKEWGNLNRCLKKYDLPKYASWGDLPRSVLPAIPDTATVQLLTATKNGVVAHTNQQLANIRFRAETNRRANEILLGNAVPGTRVEYEHRRI